MPQKPENYYRPKSLEEALALLDRPGMKPLAGGSQLLAAEEGVSAVGVVDLQALGLNEINHHAERIQVGAMVTLAALSTYLAQEATEAGATKLLQQAIQQAGPNTFRHAATLGGIVAGRVADSELLAALLVLDASVTYHAPDITHMALDAYLAAGERPFGLITHISIPWQPGQGNSVRVARTPADTPIVSVTAWQPENGAFRLAGTGIGKRPLRLAVAESELKSGVDTNSIEKAANAASAANTHPGDFRGDAVYRAEMATVLTRRALQV